MLRLKLAGRPGRRSGRRAKRRFMDAVKEYMELIGVRAKSAED